MANTTTIRKEYSNGTELEMQLTRGRNCKPFDALQVKI